MGEYIGRFAPSPSGPLHLGSLTAALASYMQARARNGRWLLRIEDLDPPREPRGTAERIMDCLHHHGFVADDPVWFQSERHPAYEDALSQLRDAGRLFACSCTRAALRQAYDSQGTQAYPGTCKSLGQPEDGCALRLRLGDESSHTFIDKHLGPQSEDVRNTCGDFVVRRRDGLFAYQLAVVVDDAAQGITEVVRGADLLDNTARQIHLQQALGLATPDYLHIPVLLDNNGLKLSKQNHAPAIDDSTPLQNLHAAWRLLGQAPLEAAHSSCEEFHAAAAQQWQPSRIPTGVEIAP